jgi:hypothetical protein
MGLETATYIGELVGTNPVTSDNRSEGDDHIRLLKLALQATFPGMAGRFGRFQSKGTGYTPVVNDSNSVIYCTAAITLSLTAAATLGNGWAVFVVASSGDVIIDPDTSELVNGVATATILSGNSAYLLCNGSSFQLIQFAAATSANVITGSLTTGGSGTILGIGTGAKMMFYQASAPTGWTAVAVNDKALRVVTAGGTGGTTGGATAYSSVFGAGKVTGAHQLTEAEIPSHVHSPLSGGASFAVGGPGSSLTGGGTVGFDATTGATGGNETHTHTLSLDLAYADVIVATKD